VLQERDRASKAEAQLKEDFQGKQAAFTKKLDADTQALRTYLEQDVRASLTSVVKVVEEVAKGSVQEMARVETLFQELEKKIGSDVGGFQGEVKTNKALEKELNQAILKLREDVAKQLDDFTLTTTNYLEEVNKSIQEALDSRADRLGKQLHHLSDRLDRLEAEQR